MMKLHDTLFCRVLLVVMCALSIAAAADAEDQGGALQPAAATDASGAEASPPLSFEFALQVATQLGAAFLLALVLVAHPMRAKRMLSNAKGRETLAAQVLIAVAGAIMVLMIGNSLARAFGLVGLGSFIRFRTVVKSAKETSLMFICIGLGMGCGLEQYALTICVTAFVFLVLFILELQRFGSLTREFKLELQPTGIEALAAARRLLEDAGAQVDSCMHRGARKATVLRGALPDGLDPTTLDAALAALTLDSKGDVEWTYLFDE